MNVISLKPTKKDSHFISQDCSLYVYLWLFQISPQLVKYLVDELLRVANAINHIQISVIYKGIRIYKIGTYQCNQDVMKQKTAPNWETCYHIKIKNIGFWTFPTLSNKNQTIHSFKILLDHSSYKYIYEYDSFKFQYNRYGSWQFKPWQVLLWPLK